MDRTASAGISRQSSGYVTLPASILEERTFELRLTRFGGETVSSERLHLSNVNVLPQLFPSVIRRSGSSSFSGGALQPCLPFKILQRTKGEEITILKRIGAGSYADVLKVIWQDRPAALKLLRHNMAVLSPRHPSAAALFSSFDKEATVLRLVEHQNIVRYFGVVKAQLVQGDTVKCERWGILEEYAESGSLEGRIWRHNATLHSEWSSKEVINWCIDIASALLCLHSNSPTLVHRDVKPANILLKYEGGRLVAKLGDFGLSTLGVPTKPVQPFFTSDSANTSSLHLSPSMTLLPTKPARVQHIDSVVASSPPASTACFPRLFTLGLGSKANKGYPASDRLSFAKPPASGSEFSEPLGICNVACADGESSPSVSSGLIKFPCASPGPGNRVLAGSHSGTGGPVQNNSAKDSAASGGKGNSPARATQVASAEVLAPVSRKSTSLHGASISVTVSATGMTLDASSFCTSDGSNQVGHAELWSRVSMNHSKTKASGPVGSYVYMAPEVFRKETCSEASDVFSFGIVMFELLAGKLVFQEFGQPGTAADVNARALELTERISRGWRPPFPSVIPKTMRKLIRSCWQQNPARRPPMDKVVSKLQKAAATIGGPTDVAENVQAERGCCIS